MTDNEKNPDIGTAKSLTGGEDVSANAGISAAIKRVLATDLAECKWSRARVAAELSRAAGRAITEHQIDAYTAETKVGYRFPVELLPAWVKVTGSTRLLTLVCEEAGMYLADQTERDLAELGRGTIQRERLERQSAELKARLSNKV